MATEDRNGRKLRWWRVVFAVALISAGIDQAQAQVDEYHVKAAFLLGFSRYVEWPKESFKGPKEPITICILGSNPFGNSLSSAISGQTVGSRMFALRQIGDVPNLENCQILFVSFTQRKRFRTLTDGVPIPGVLTVGEARDFLADGGVITFQREDGKIRFEISVGAAEQAKLYISAQLLALARLVKD